jgi:hypothetical protein
MRMCLCIFPPLSSSFHLVLPITSSISPDTGDEERVKKKESRTPFGPGINDLTTDLLSFRC